MLIRVNNDFVKAAAGPRRRGGQQSGGGCAALLAVGAASQPCPALTVFALSGCVMGIIQPNIQ